jgi:hypothetical protein
LLQVAAGAGGTGGGEGRGHADAGAGAEGAAAAADVDVDVDVDPASGVERGDQQLTEEAMESFKVFDDNDGYGDPDDETGNEMNEELIVADGLSGAATAGGDGGDKEGEGDADGRHDTASAEDDADAGADSPPSFTMDSGGDGDSGGAGELPRGMARVAKPTAGGFKDYAPSEDDYHAFWDGTDGDDEGGSRFSEEESGRGRGGGGGSGGGGGDGVGDRDGVGVPSADDDDVGAVVPPPSRGASPHAGWEEEDFQQRAREEAAEDEWVFVDAHLLCTPAAADINNDGRVELVLAVGRGIGSRV